MSGPGLCLVARLVRSSGDGCGHLPPLHLPLPSPKTERCEKVVQSQRVRNEHDLPRRIVDELRQAHNEPLVGPEAQSGGGMAIRKILEKRLRVDRAATLPIKDRGNTLHPRVEVQRAGVATAETIDRALDGQRFESNAGGPVLPALNRPRRRVWQAGLRARIVAQHPAEMPLNSRMD